MVGGKQNLKYICQIENALFHKNYTRNKNPHYIFKNPIQNFEICEYGTGPSSWAIVGPKKTEFLNIVASKYFPSPKSGRRYAYSTSMRHNGIQFLTFQDTSGIDKVHVAARYESYSSKGALEMSSSVNSVLNFITGANNYNSSIEIDTNFALKLMENLDLLTLQHKWINNLSNGQMRRARLARVLHNKPKLLVIDDLFLGLDYQARESVAQTLCRVTAELQISVVLGLSIHSQIPDCITHVAYVDESGIVKSGEKLAISKDINDKLDMPNLQERSQVVTETNIDHIEFKNASVKYKNAQILQNFNWKVKKGSRWRIVGPNGSGKTTILSLITADHPQSWRSVLKIDGTLRKPGKGITYFSINNKIGISSPELHAIVPSDMSMNDVILTGLVPNVGNFNFNFRYKNKDISHHAQSVLKIFNTEIADRAEKSFGELPLRLQKLALFLRAVVKQPEILILDEAFSCMEDTALMAKCQTVLNDYMRETTVLSIAHLDWEVLQYDHTVELLGDEKNGYNIHDNKY